MRSGAAQTPHTPRLCPGHLAWEMAPALECPRDAGALPAQGGTLSKFSGVPLARLHSGSSELLPQQLVPKTLLALICLSSPLKRFFGAVANVHLRFSNSHSAPKAALGLSPAPSPETAEFKGARGAWNPQKHSVKSVAWLCGCQIRALLPTRA